MNTILETDRLILREIFPSDQEALFEMDSDPEVHRFLGNEPVKEMSQIFEVINFIRNQYLENGIGRWAVIEKNSGLFIGWCGLKLIIDEADSEMKHYDLGYRFNKNFWGKGYATESAKACLQYGFEKMNLSEIFSLTHIQNQGSKNVLKKLGFHHIDTVFDHDEMADKWKISKIDWINCR